MRALKCIAVVAAIAIPMLMACNKEQDDGLDRNRIEDSVSDNEKGVFVTFPVIEFDDLLTRGMIMNEETYGIHCEEGEKISIWSNQGTLALYTLTDISGDAKSATFDGGGFVLANGSTYHSSYPARYTYESELTALPLDMTVQVQKGNDNTDHLMKSMIFYASATCTDGRTSFGYQSGTSFVRMKLTVPEAITATEVSLIAESAVFAPSGAFNVTTGAFSADPVVDKITFGLDGIEVAEGGVLIVNMAIMPYAATNVRIEVKGLENKTFCSELIPQKALALGKCRQIIATLTNGAVEPVAQIGSQTFLTLSGAAEAAQSGDVIELLADVENAGQMIVLPGVTVEGNGHVLSGNSSMRLGNGAVVNNVKFQNIHNESTKLSAVYGSASATVTNCTFTDCDWDSIQFTPVAGSVLTITGNTFEETSSDPNSVTAQRFVHIQSAANVDFSATVTGNKMSGTTEQGKLECYYFTDRTKIDLTHNYIDDRNGASGVCILENSGANVAELLYPVYTDETMATEYTPAAIIKKAYSHTEYETLNSAAAAAQAGDVITILQDISDAGSVNIPANVSLEGNDHVISGNSSMRLGNGAVVNNVKFQNIHNESTKLSAVYGSASATVTNCTFTDCDWDSIQFTPVAGSVLTITGNTFEETSSDPNSVTAQRFVHIQSAANVDFSATVTGNKMSGTTEQGKLECYYFTDRTKIDLTHNYIDNRNGASGVCVLEKSGANVSEMVYPVYTDADMTTEFTPVAIVKEPYSITEYATIQDAFNAQDGKVIAIAAGSHSEVVNVTGGKTATFEPMVGADVALAGINHSTNGTPSTITVKDITIDNGLQTEGWFTGTSQNINPCVGAWGGHFAFDGCTFKVSGASKYETGIMTWWVVEKTTFDFDNCVFEASDAAGNKPSSARAMQIYGDVDMTVDGCTFTTAKSYSLKYVGKEGSTAVFNDNTVSNSTCFVQLGSAPYAGTGYSLSLNNTTYSGEIAPYLIDNEENQTVYIDGVKVYPTNPVHIGSNSYAAIQDAFNAAQNGDVITVDTGTYNEVVDVTGGKTVTIQATAGANVALAGINHSTNGTPSTITVKDITIDNGLQTEGWFTGTSQNINPCVGAWGGHFAFDGCTFKVSGASKYETGIMTWWVVEKTTFDFDNCVFEASDAAGNKPSSARAMQIYGDVDMTVDGCTFTTAKSYSLKYVGKEGSTAVFNDNTVSNSTCFVQLGSAPYAGTGYSLSLNNTTYSGEIAPYLIDNEENQTVYIDGVKVYPAVPDYETDANGNLSIYTAAGMLYFASQVNDSQVSYSGKTITLMDNIDMTGIDWIPVGQTGGYAAQTYFRGTFDGNGKTISNLTVTHWEEGTNGGANYASGLFGFIDAAGATVKDLTMDNANVTGSHWTGAIVGYLSGEISGCTVKNSSVVCTNKNSEANGDKAGLITGYINGTQGTVTNCTGSNSTVQAFRDAGQLVGAAKSTQVSDCTATNVTVTGTGGGNIRNEVIGRLL